MCIFVQDAVGIAVVVSTAKIHVDCFTPFAWTAAADYLGTEQGKAKFARLEYVIRKNAQ